ncbi:penicillin-binding transpeptidase domain-containing protein [Streptomyces sp. NPDC005865]|uniref:penicillin-binding transpeptidase domain-containing protein n=1 Tax=Streptomyces sp. NPDC005865 TaxID=3155453 RepID=UPI0033EAB0AA
MNRCLRHIAAFCGLLALTLLLRDSWLQTMEAKELSENRNNRRVAIEKYALPLGNIIAGGKPITGSEKTRGDLAYKRTYKDGPMWAPVTGYASQAFGIRLLEGTEERFLAGTDRRLTTRSPLHALTGEPAPRGDVVTTLLPSAQKAAYRALGKRKGAIAALNPETGAILALVSTPSYDPGSFAGHGESDREAWQKLLKENNPDEPVLNRALRQTYPPGSTFKVVTAAAALEHGLYRDINTPTRTPLPWTMPDTRTPLNNEGNLPCKNATLNKAMEVSCNTVFGKISADVGNKKMQEQAAKFGYDRTIDTPVRTVKSVYPKDNRPQNAMAGIGQASNRATPLQVAMIAAAVANDGVLMRPYMVDRWRGEHGRTVSRTKPRALSRAMSTRTAHSLQNMLTNVISHGTGAGIGIPGATVGGKTGTAEHGDTINGKSSEKPYAWFMSYATKPGATPVAVAVVVEADKDMPRNDIAGSRYSAPLAKKVMEAVLHHGR